MGNTPGVLTETTADLAFALILACARGLLAGADDVRAGRWTTWSPEGWLGRDVHGATLGIVGAGDIGMAVARRAEGFGMKVLLNGSRPGPDRVELGELLGRSDFVSLHCPLNEETRGLIGERELRSMRPAAYLVNTARGPIVDGGALRRALEEGWIAGAGLDVTDPEPLPADDPLLGAPNLTVRAAHRLGDPCDAQGDGGPRRRQPDRRAGGRADAACRRAGPAGPMRPRARLGR